MTSPTPSEPIMTKHTDDELNNGEDKLTLGQTVWHSSDEDAGPDVGLQVGLGDDTSLYVGELARRTVEEAGVDLAAFPDAWWIATFGASETQVIAAVANDDAARDFFETIAALGRRAQAAEARARTAEGEVERLKGWFGARHVCLLEYSQGSHFVWVVWALKPSVAHVAAICTTEEKADRYMADLPDNGGLSYRGSKMWKERVPLDHAFGWKDSVAAMVTSKGSNQ